VNVRDEAGEIIQRRQVSTAWERVTAFLDELGQRTSECGGYVAVVEVCDLTRQRTFIKVAL